MAFSAPTGYLGANNGDTTRTSNAVTFTVATGELLYATLNIDKNSGTINTPSGWTLIGTTIVNTSISQASFYLISAAGAETSASFTWTNSVSSRVAIEKYSATGTISFDVAAQADSGDTAVTSQTTGTTATTDSAGSLVIGSWTADSANNFETGISVSGSGLALRTEVYSDSGDYSEFSPPIIIADNLSFAVGTAECTVTTTDTGDQAIGRIAVFTETSTDTTAPVLTLPTGTKTGSTTATGTITTDEGNGTAYAIVSTSATPPSVAQIQAGNDSTGSAAAWDGSQAISTTGLKTFLATGLTASTTYYFYFQHQDAATNDSTVSSSASFLTDATPTTTATVTIAGGASLTGLSYSVYDGYNIGADSIVDQGTGETTDGSGVLVIDLAGLGLANTDPVTIVVSDYTTTPTAGSSGAVCYTTVVVA